MYDKVSSNIRENWLIINHKYEVNWLIKKILIWIDIYWLIEELNTIKYWILFDSFLIN